MRKDGAGSQRVRRFCVSGWESIELPQPYILGRICAVAIGRMRDRQSTTQ